MREDSGTLHKEIGYNIVMTTKEERGLRGTAREVRSAILEMVGVAGSGHIGGSLSSADIVTYLYFHGLKFNPQNIKDNNRDRLVLSAGHICPAFYGAFYKMGIIDKEEMLTMRQIDSNLQGHPDRSMMPIFETSSGSLGHGLSIAVGMALALRYKNNNSSKVVCLMSDGEQEEGSVWEAVMAGSHYKLDSLIAIIDRNGMQISGTTENVIGLAPIDEKYRAFGWRVLHVDGHDFQEIDRAFHNAISGDGPTVIIARTVMGKGVKQIENDYHWHGKAIDEKTAKQMIDELS